MQLESPPTPFVPKMQRQRTGIWPPAAPLLPPDSPAFPPLPPCPHLSAFFSSAAMASDEAAAASWEDLEAEAAPVRAQRPPGPSLGSSSQLLAALQTAASADSYDSREPMVVLNISAMTQGAVNEKPREGSPEEGLVADVLAVVLGDDFDEEADALFEAEIVFHAEREQVRGEGGGVEGERDDEGERKKRKK